MRRIVPIIAIIALLVALGTALYFLFRERPRSDLITLYGNVDVRQVDIGFRVPGRVETLYYEEGDFVAKGSLMALLEKSPYDSQVVQAKGTLDSATAMLENAKILLDRRVQAALVGGVSKEEVDNAEASYADLLGNVHTAEAALTVASDNLSYTAVYAPTDGVILTRIREPGTAVNAVDPVYTLSVSSPVWVRAYIDETGLGEIYYGMEADIATDSGKSYTGLVGFISPVAEFTPKTVETTQLRTDLVYRMRIYADNPDRYLKQGMPVTVKLYKKSREPR